MLEIHHTKQKLRSFIFKCLIKTISTKITMNQKGGRIRGGRWTGLCTKSKLNLKQILGILLFIHYVAMIQPYGTMLGS